MIDTPLALLYSLFLLTIFVGLFVVERLSPLRKPTQPALNRVLLNFAMIGLAYVAGFFLVRPTANHTLQWVLQEEWGLMHWLSLSPTFSLLLSFLLMDLSFYYWHRLNHRVPILWRFHQIHHIDPDLDVTTAGRFHCVEIAYSSLFRLIQISLIGISAWHYFIYEAFFQVATLFHHSNWRLNYQFEKLLNLIFVTPRMHGIHHSQIRNETNANYGVLFSFWDRLHRSLVNVPQKLVRIGVPGYAQSNDNRFFPLQWFPFQSQRAYWNKHQFKRDSQENTSNNILME